MLTPSQQTAAATITDCYQQLHEKQSNLVLEVVGAEPLLHPWQHYPKNDVKDKHHHSQYYYHSHPSKADDRVAEHGHFHLFFRKALFDDTEPVLHASQKFLNDPKKDAFCHIAAIAMNEQGFPTALFTVNHWVVKGLHYPAETIIRALDHYRIALPAPSPLITNTWMTAMVALFKEGIAELLLTRDAVITEWQNEHPEGCVYEDRGLEITSVLPLA